MFEMFQLDFMMQAFIISLIIGVVLSYLGIHVVTRGIVFVDLALGQISSLGVAYSDYVGYGKTVIPILFALAGAFLMSLINIKDKRLKLEAIIGIIYAIASAITVMLISKTPHGDSDIQEVLFGNILSVDSSQIMIAGIVFGTIAFIHLLFFKKFYSASALMAIEHNSNSIPSGRKLFNFWNFAFYLSIGLAIVFSVRTSGVIPVFAFLIIPAVAAMMLSKKNSGVFVFAILITILGIFFGLNVSYKFDFPAGSSLVAVLGGLFAGVSLLYLIKNRFLKIAKKI